MTDPQSQAAPAANAEGGGKIRLEAWSWGGAFLAVSLLLVFAWGIGFPLRSLAHKEITPLTVVAIVTGSIAAVSFLALSARRVVEFFLSVRVGVAILVFFALGSIASVLVHPRDPEKYLDRGPEQAERLHKDDFGWATGYFLYHLLHPYGWGMPTIEVPQGAQDGVARLAQQYGARLGKQEESGMRTALNGNLRGSEIREFIRDHQAALDRTYEICCFLQLNGTHTGKGAWSSDWFAALMKLLFVIVLANTFRRGIARAIAQGAPGFGFLKTLPAALLWDLKSLASIDRIGFLVTHLGVLIALAGGLASRLTEQRGIVQLSIDPLREGQPQESYRFWLYSGRQSTFDPPFAVRLANFRADYRDTLDIEFLGPAARTKTVPSFRYFEVWPGRQIGLDYDAKGEGAPKTIVRVLDHWPRSNVSLDLAERKPDDAPRHMLEDLGPAVKLGLSGGAEGSDTEVGGTFLFAGHKDYALLYEVPGLRLQLENAKNREEQEVRLQVPFEGEAFGAVGVAPAEMGKPPIATKAIEPGAEIEFDTPKGKAKIRVVRALPDARLLPTPTGRLEPQFASVPAADLPPLHPGVELLISDPASGQSGRKWFYESARDFLSGDDGSMEIGGARFRFPIVWDRWRSPARARYRLVLAPGAPAKLAKVGGGEPAILAVGANVALEGAVQLRLEARADLPKLVPVIQPIPGDPDDDAVFFDHHHPPACRVEVDGPEGKQTFTLAASDLADTAVYAGRLRLNLFENTFDLPREWKSKLEFMEPDPAGKSWVVKDTQTIRVNDYAYYRGYRFFQTDANRQLPGYSGVGVVYDPGIETVLVGLYMVVFGVAYVFLVKPLLRRKRT